MEKVIGTIQSKHDKTFETVSTITITSSDQSVWQNEIDRFNREVICDYTSHTNC